MWAQKVNVGRLVQVVLKTIARLKVTRDYRDYGETLEKCKGRSSGV